MKKLITILFLATVVMNTTTIAAIQSESNSIMIASTVKQVTATEVTTLTNRLNEIRKMDLNRLSSVERQHLRSEVIGIKQRFSEPLGGGVYISAGALIIIIILLIIIL